ncbi:MAG: GerMN domain-containing protein [Acidimicrobiia bacterium]|nr:GerMN domain-containing protein [Acidimicrobiia bacterium]
MRTTLRALTAPLLVALLLGAAACGGDDDSSGDEATSTSTPSGDAVTTTAPDATTTTAPALTDVLVYFLRDEKVAVVRREVPDDGAPAAAALRALLAGPDDDEASLGFVTTIPDGTELNGVVIEDGVATVDLSSAYDDGGGTSSVTTRLASVVFTLTQFPTVDSVLFELDGEPVTEFSGEGFVLDGPVGRADFEYATPLILVESPAPGDVVASPLTITGSNNTFESGVEFRLEDASGATIAEGYTTGTGGMGTMGPFEGSLEFDPGAETSGTLVVYESSARDGTEINVTEVPVRF